MDQLGRVIAMVLRETIGLVIAGLALGAGLSYTASTLINSRLYGVASQDPLTMALATGLLLLVVLKRRLLAGAQGVESGPHDGAASRMNAWASPALA